MNDVRPLPPTHEVSNQPPPLADHEPLRNHHALREALAREGAAWAASTLAAEAQQLAQPEWQERGRLANTFTPELKSHDRYGRRRDEVEFHPAWHECLGWLKARGCDTGPWADPRPGAHVARAALFMLFAEVEAGSLCPTTMTYGAVPVVRQDPALAEPWLRLLLSRTYDGRFLPAEEKRGVMIGMGLTEKQGGFGRARQHHARRAHRQGRVSPHRPQMVSVRGDVRCVFGHGANGARPLVLLPAPLDAGRPTQRPALVALERQAGRPLQCHRRSRIRGCLGEAGGRRGARHPHRSGNGQLHPPRLRLGFHGLDARRLQSCTASRAASGRFRQSARRPALDAKRVGRPGARSRSRDGSRDAHRPRHRPARSRRRRASFAPRLHAHRQILGVQTRRAIRRRSHGSAGRQRLRRRSAPGALLPSTAGEFDLGRIGQRDVPRRPARSRKHPRIAELLLG